MTSRAGSEGDIGVRQGRGRRYPCAVTPEQLSALVVAALTSLVDDGRLTLPDGVPATVTVERPRSKDHGDYATNVALQLGKRAGFGNPRELAQMLADELATAAGIARVDIAGPGFLNITVAAGAQGQVAADVVAAGSSYGHTDVLAGTAINVEFISANPTGPLHLGHTRWAAVGDALARVLAAAGASVSREFYINDRGRQMDLFGASVEAVALGQPVPEDGYHGAYIADLAREVVSADPGLIEVPDGERAAAFRDAAYAVQLEQQKAQLETFRTHFDVWFSERSLHESQSVAENIEKLRGEGHLYDADGALWMRTTDAGDDRDRVLIRSNGELTYFASDTAYYLDKRSRGFDVCIYLLGADHHGYVGRLQAMAACAGDDPVVQPRGGDRAAGQDHEGRRGAQALQAGGTIVTLEELVELIGVDALRYTLARYPADSPLTLDVAEMTLQASDNPVFYVEYGHARVSSICATPRPRPRAGVSRAAQPRAGG